MCIKLEDVEKAVNTAIDPIKASIGELKKSLEKLAGVQVKHVELEGHLLHLQKTSDGVRTEFDDIWKRQRVVEGLQATVNSYEKQIEANTRKIDEQDTMIKNRTFTILMAFVTMLLGGIGAFIVTVIGGSLVWIFRANIGG
jgi:hypothetical protein